MGGGDKGQQAPAPPPQIPPFQQSPIYNPADYTTLGATQPRGAFLPIEEPESDYFDNLMEDLFQRMKARTQGEGFTPEIAQIGF